MSSSLLKNNAILMNFIQDYLDKGRKIEFRIKKD